jgi:hypothetical protein
MLNTPPPPVAGTQDSPQSGQQVSGINYQQPQAFTLPGAQGDSLLRRGINSPFASNPISTPSLAPPQANPMMPSPGGSTGSVGMASALMNPWR